MGLVTEFEVVPKDTYDADETGFVMGNIQSQRVLNIIRHPRSRTITRAKRRALLASWHSSSILIRLAYALSISITNVLIRNQTTEDESLRCNLLSTNGIKKLNCLVQRPKKVTAGTGFEPAALLYPEVGTDKKDVSSYTTQTVM